MPTMNDTFDRVNSATLGTATSGQVWTSMAGAVRILNNRAKPDEGPIASGGSYRESFSVIETGFKYFTMSADLGDNNGGMGLYFRVANADNWWRLGVSRGWGTQQSQTYITLTKCVAGNRTIVRQHQTTTPITTMKVTCRDASIVCSINNQTTNLFSYTDTFNQAMTRHGIGHVLTGVQTTNGLDNWSITSINQSPNRANITAPLNGAIIDAAAGFGVSFTFSDDDSTDTMHSWALRRKVSGATTYEYFNKTTNAWQSTIVWNADAVANNTSFTWNFSAGLWTNGYVYNYSVAYRDQSLAQVAFTTDKSFTAGNAPSVDVLSPEGVVRDDSTPMVEWSYFDPENDPQATYQVKIFTQAQYSATGFDPTTAAAFWDSGEVVDANARTRDVGTSLTNPGTFRAYVRCSQAGASYTPWAFSDFTMNLVAPAAPTLTVTPNDDLAYVKLDVQSNDGSSTTNTYRYNNVYFTVEFSDATPLVAGPDLVASKEVILATNNWTPIGGGEAVKPNPTTGKATLYDSEVPSLGGRTYRAFTKADV